MAETIGARSKCSRDKVGAVIVSSQNRIIDTGYNGPPRGMYLVGGECKMWCPRGQKRVGDQAEVLKNLLDPTYDDCFSLHAEQNALMFSDRRLREGGSIYVSSGVCGVCAKLIANSGLTQCIMLDRTDAVHRKTDKWCEFLEQCGITVVTLL